VTADAAHEWSAEQGVGGLAAAMSDARSTPLDRHEEPPEEPPEDRPEQRQASPYRV
jgi:hypothetical protein